MRVAFKYFQIATKMSNNELFFVKLKSPNIKTAVALLNKSLLPAVDLEGNPALISTANISSYHLNEIDESEFVEFEQNNKELFSACYLN